MLCYIYIVSLLIVFVVQSTVVDTPVRNNVSAQFSQPSRPHFEVRGTQQLVPRVCFMNMSVLRILCATYVVPFLTPFVVSLRSLMNIAGEATMNQLLWNRRRALQRNLLGTSELPKLQSRPCKIVNNPLRLRRQHTQHTIT